MTFVQFTRFGMPEGRRATLLAARRESLATCRAAHPELRGVFLVRLEGGDWLDIAIWAGHNDSGRQTAPFPPPGARAQFFEQIDELIGEESGLMVAEAPDSSLCGD
jgi:hypothetical protein